LASGDANRPLEGIGMAERFARRGAQALVAFSCVWLASDICSAQFAMPNPLAPAPARPPQAIRVLPTGKAPLVEMRLGVASMYKTEKPFSSIVVGAPSIMEVHVVTDRTMTLVPVALGLTNVLFLDDKGDPVANVEFMVTDGRPDPAEVTDIGPGRVRIYNKRPLTSFTAYRCNRVGCQYVDELVAKEPAPPLPTRQIIEERREVIDRSAPPRQ
jgi:hypothetical protein